MRFITAAITLVLSVLCSVPVAAAPLKPPNKRPILVAFVLTEGATMIDFAGPWEVFQDVHVHDRGETMEDMMPFRLYVVSGTREPFTASGGMKIVPDYTFDDAPQPHVVVVGAQRGAPGLEPWLRKVAPKADVVMSVCTGAFIVARAGLYDGKRATTHHAFFDAFEKQFPRVELLRGRRFVDADGKVASSGGLTSGIDLALHVVARYFGEEVAGTTADYMEYESDGWRSGKAKKRSIGE